MCEEFSRIEIAKHHPTANAPRSGVNAERPLSARTRSDLINASSLRLVDGKARTVGLRMPQMEHAGREAAVLAMHARADHADDDIGILQSPAGKGGVETIDPIEICAEEREVAAARALPRGSRRLRSAPSGRLNSGSRRLTSPRARRAGPGCRSSRFPARDVLRRICSRQSARQQHAVAGDETAAAPRARDAPRRNPAARCNRRRGRSIVAGARQDRAIADFGEAEAAVFVPDMLERNAELSASMHREHRGSAAPTRRPPRRSRNSRPSAARASAAPRRARRGGCRSRRSARSAQSRRCLASHAFM